MLSCSLEGGARSRDFEAFPKFAGWVERPRTGSGICCVCCVWGVAMTLDRGRGRRDEGLGRALVLLTAAPDERFSSILTLTLVLTDRGRVKMVR